MLALGIDIGTTTISAALVDAGGGKVLDSRTIEGSPFLPAAHPWERLQDPALILSRARTLVADIITRHGRPAALGVTGQMHGIVYLDGQGRALGPLFTWQDGRGDQPSPEGIPWAAALSARTGTRLATGYGAITHWVNQRQGTVPEGAAVFCTIHDYVAMALCGRTAPLTHTTDAASFGLFDLAQGGFDTQAIQGAGLDPDLFPAVTGGMDVLGTTPEGIPVTVALGDNQASFLGSVGQTQGSVLVNVGTGSQISFAAPSPMAAPGMEARPFVDGGFLLVGAPLCGGRAYALLEKFFRQVSALSGQYPAPLYGVMNALAEDFDTLRDPLTVRTQFSGTREDPALRGSISGLGEDNFTPRHFVTGVLMGTVNELWERYADLPDRHDAILVGAGNGLRRNPALQRMFSARFGMPLFIPAHTEEAAYGAALFALAGAGCVPGLDDAQRIIQYAKETGGGT